MCDLIHKNIMNNNFNQLNEWIATHSTKYNHLYAILAGTATSDALTNYGRLDGAYSPEGIWLNTPYQQWYDLMPYIVKLSPQSPFLTWLSNTTTCNWGWLAFSHYSQTELVPQLKLLTKVILPDNKEVFFRYWDGGFLAKILMASTREQQQTLLSGFSTLWLDNQVINLPESSIQDNHAMITLTAQQLSLLDEEKLYELRQELKLYLKTNYPKKSRMLGSKSTERFLDSIMKKINQYQIPRKDQAKQFLDLALILGTHFDTDPMLYHWVNPRLITVATDIISLIELNEDLSTPLRMSMGPNLSIYLERLEQLLQKPIHSLFEITNENQVVEFVINLYPERYQQLPFNTLENFYQLQIPYYNSQLFFNYSSHAVLLAMQFFLGHAVFEDPLYPWINEIISKNNQLSEKESIEHIINYTKKRIRKEIIHINFYLKKMMDS